MSNGQDAMVDSQRAAGDDCRWYCCWPCLIAQETSMCYEGMDCGVWTEEHMYCRAWTVEYGHLHVWTHGRSKFNLKWAKVSPKVTNLGPNDPMLSPTWGELGQIGSKSDQHSPKLVPCWSKVAPSWPEAIPNWPKLTPKCV